jgi:hypothetical protein
LVADHRAPAVHEPAGPTLQEPEVRLCIGDGCPPLGGAVYGGQLGEDQFLRNGVPM